MRRTGCMHDQQSHDHRYCKQQISTPPPSSLHSDLRQVPDHQEAFVSREDGIGIVIELLSFETEISSELDGKGDGASARHFFDDLAAANGSSSSACDYCADLSDRCERTICTCFFMTICPIRELAAPFL